MGETRGQARSGELTTAAPEAATAVLGTGGPVQMVSLLRYRAQADYGSDAGAACSGREAYFGRYIPAVDQVVAARGLGAAQQIRVVWVGSARASVVAPDDEEWDDVAVAEYPDFAAFRRVVESPAYARYADPHRTAALRDWRLIATVPAAMP